MIAHRPRAEVRLLALARFGNTMPRPRHLHTRLLLFVALLLALLPAGLLPTPALAQPSCQITHNGAPGGSDLGTALGYAGCPTITFAAGVNEVTVPAYLTIDRAVTIQGPGADKLTIRYSGVTSNLGSVFYIKGGPATLSGLTVADGKASGGVFGAGLSIAPPVGTSPVAVTLDGVRVLNNATTSGAGGGIYASNAALTITNSRIEGNAASGCTAPRQGGGGLFLDNGFGHVSATLTNVVIVGNTSQNAGGGIGAVNTVPGDTQAVTLTVNNSTVGTVAQPNTAELGGGISGDSSIVVVTNSTIGGNVANAVIGGGGGVYTSGSTTTVTNSTISGNVANAVLGGGGGVYTLGSTTTVTNSTISDNSAYIIGGFSADSGATMLRFVTITGNTAISDGGIGGLSFKGGSLAMLSSIVAGNTKAGVAGDCGGTITSAGRNLWGDQTACPNNAVGGDQNLFALNVALAAVINPTLADNGGPTKTHNLVAGGPAVNKGDNVTCATAEPDGAGGRDQRNVPRNDGKCDVGAVEYTAAPPSPSPSPSPSAPPSFADVPAGYWAHDQIGTFAQRGITTGCGDNDQGQRLYCPERGVTRAEMATFLTRALGQDKQTPPATPTFADVPADYWAYGQIEAFVKLGITTGCGTDGLGRRIFCPDRGVTRAEMAAFLDRAKSQTELPSATPTFADVPPGYWAYGWIERFFTLSITTGCGADDQGRKVYCPDRGVTRAEMAVFIIRAYP